MLAKKFPKFAQDLSEDNLILKMYKKVQFTNPNDNQIVLSAIANKLIY